MLVALLNRRSFGWVMLILAATWSAGCGGGGSGSASTPAEGAGAGWDAATDISGNTDPVGLSYPTVMDADGNVYAAWMSREPHPLPSRAIVRSYDARMRAWTPIRELSSGGAMRAVSTGQTQLDDEGNAFMAWNEVDGLSPPGGVYRVARYNYADREWSDPIQISAGPSKYVSAEMSVSPGGNVLLAWRTLPIDQAAPLYVRRYIRSTGSWSGDVQVSPNGRWRGHSALFDSSGNGFFLWDSGSGSRCISRISASTSELTTTCLNPVPVYSPTHFAFFVDHSGDAFLVERFSYSSYAYDPQPYLVTRYDHVSNSWISGTVLESTPGGTELRLSRVFVDSRNDVFLVVERTSPGIPWSSQAAVFRYDNSERLWSDARALPGHVIDAGEDDGGDVALHMNTSPTSGPLTVEDVRYSPSTRTWTSTSSSFVVPGMKPHPRALLSGTGGCYFVFTHDGARAGATETGIISYTYGTRAWGEPRSAGEVNGEVKVDGDGNVIIAWGEVVDAMTTGGRTWRTIRARTYNRAKDAWGPKVSFGITSVPWEFMLTVGRGAGFNIVYSTQDVVGSPSYKMHLVASTWRPDS